MAIRKKYGMGVQQVDTRPGATGAEKITRISQGAGYGSKIGGVVGKAFGPLGELIVGAAGAGIGAGAGAIVGNKEQDMAANAALIDQEDKMNIYEQNMAYGGTESTQVKNAFLTSGRSCC